MSFLSSIKVQLKVLPQFNQRSFLSSFKCPSSVQLKFNQRSFLSSIKGPSSVQFVRSSHFRTILPKNLPSSHHGMLACFCRFYFYFLLYYFLDLLDSLQTIKLFLTRSGQNSAKKTAKTVWLYIRLSQITRSNDQSQLFRCFNQRMNLNELNALNELMKEF